MRKKATRARPEANPVTPAAADAFAMRMKHWQDAMNLHDWRVERSPRPAGRNSLAEVTSMSLRARLAVYRLGSDFGETMPVTEQSLDEVSCHEMGHVLLHELITVCRDPASTEDDIEAAEHRVIHTLVRMLVGH